MIAKLRSRISFLVPVVMAAVLGGFLSVNVPDAKADSTIAQFMKIRAPFNGRLAVDGTFYCVDWPDGIYQLYRTPRGGSMASMEKITSFADGISNYVPSDDGKWIVLTAADGGSEQDDLYLMDASTGRIRVLFEDPEVVYGSATWRRDSQAFAYRANDASSSDFHIYVYDLDSRQHKAVFQREGYYYPVDFNANGDRLVVGKYTSASYSQLFEVNLDDGSIREITPQGEQSSFDGVGYTADERQFIVVSNYGGDRKLVQQIELSTSRVAPLFSEFAGFDVDSATMNTERTVLAINVNEDGYGTLYLRDLATLQPLEAPAMNRGVTGNVNFTGNTLLYSLNNANTPGLIYKWSLDHAQIAPVALTKADTRGVDIKRFRLPELVKYKSFDGLEVPAFLYLPAGYKKGTQIPWLVYYHGGPEGQFRPTFFRSFQYFVSRGFGVMAPNVRGSDGYGMKYLEMDNYKKRMDSVRDGVEAARWLVTQGYAKPKGIAAWGASYGGFMVMATITEAPDLFGAAANSVGIVNFETFLQRTKDYRRALREAEYGPLSDPEFLRSISPIYKIDRIQTPLLVAHGLNDPRVPVEEALQLVVGLLKLGRPVEQLIFPDEGHGFRKEENRILYYEHLARFFDRHLNAGN